jgi:hypothetical protein
VVSPEPKLVCVINGGDHLDLSSLFLGGAAMKSTRGISEAAKACSIRNRVPTVLNHLFNGQSDHAKIPALLSQEMVVGPSSGSHSPRPVPPASGSGLGS